MPRCAWAGVAFPASLDMTRVSLQIIRIASRVHLNIPLRRAEFIRVPTLDITYAERLTASVEVPPPS